MANDTDFLSLYQELGVSPDSGLAALRQAYRRRVSQIHPDRRTTPLDSTRGLQRLNALYEAAVDFERRHGRLPGSTQTAAPRHRPPHIGRVPFIRSVKPAPRGRTLYMRLFLLGIVVAITLLYVYIDEEKEAEPEDSDTPSLGVGAVNTHAAPRARATVDLGMDAREVLEIEGEPISRSQTLWEYGPSWIGFECNVVTDWYSSPMRPLKVATPHPVPQAAEAPARIHCIQSGSAARAESGPWAQASPAGGSDEHGPPHA
jgi:hypothetical protein